MEKIFRSGLLLFSLIALSVPFCGAKTALPSLKKKLPALNDLPAPAGLQASVVGNEATLTWSWQLPEQHPQFLSFGFQIERADGKNWTVPATTFSDFNLAFGTYTYRVRVLGEDKEGGKRLMHQSDWSEGAQAVVKVACLGAPAVELHVQPYNPSRSDSAALRFRLTGAATVPAGCHLSKTTYRIDAMNGTHITGDLSADAHGHFESDVASKTSDDEEAGGGTSYTVTVTAEDEAGPTTSDAFSVNLERQNPFAPKQTDY
jgi:hypothetical protein